MLASRQMQSPRSLFLPTQNRRFLGALLGLLLVFGTTKVEEVYAGPKGKWVGEIAKALLGVAAVHYGAKALAERRAESAPSSEPDSLKQCFVDLLTPSSDQNPPASPMSMMLDHLQQRRRLDRAAAEDIAYAVLTDLCLRHSQRPYDNLVAAFYKASGNRANRFFTRYQQRYLACENIESLADRCVGNVPGVPAAEETRLRSEVDVVHRVWCSLDTQQQQILLSHAADDESFPQIDAKLGLVAGQAKNRYFNTLRWVQAQIQAACPSY